QLMEVSRFGAKAFQQAAGFLRIHEGEDPLDASAVHPETYPVVQRICQLTGKAVPELIGNDALLDSLDPKVFVDDTFGVETVKDILAELKKPGRDPRRRFEAVQFMEGVNKPSDLESGMELQGIVTNVTQFGAFVDIGVHQDGLVHLSEISHTYVKSPADVLSVGQAVQVKVLTVDLQAKRIGLSIKALVQPPPASHRPERHAGHRPRPERPKPVVQDQRPPRPERPHDRPRRREERKPESREAAPARKPEVRGASLDDLLAKFNKGIH
ncbi:MAG TPA: S1 RNA-binding domain-containing protein, partial [Holophaga sp.]|nr:S1 RNA-binding domain-containing protein [Holophaga sp.]